MTDEFTREQWATVLEEADLATFGELVAALEGRDFVPGDPATIVEEATAADGPLVEGESTGTYPEYRLAPESGGGGADEEDANPWGSTGETTEDGPGTSEVRDIPGEDTPREAGGAWVDADFTAPIAGEWQADLLEREQWMGRQGKLPFAPWGDRNADLECKNPEHDADTTAECDCDARWKWGHTGHYVDGETVAIAESDPRLDGRVFLQQEDDPNMFVDGDDVRCPETGEVHPVFVEVLERLGLTYADISVSDSGAHANYRGELPDGVKQATFAIDEEPWGANDDVPEIEIYDGKHVCVATGKHVPGTPLETRPCDEDALRAVLDEYDQLPEEPAPAERRDAFDADDYNAGATESDETTDDIRDVFAALDQLDARDVAEKTIVDEWKDPSGTDDRAFIPTWAPSGYDGTANFVNEKSWTDSGNRGGYGGAVVMAAIDCADISYNETDADDGKVEGAKWWQAVDHLRDLGFSIPKHVGGASSGSDDDRRDPRDVKVTPDPEVAWRAAAAVTPEGLEEALPLAVATDGETAGWECPATGTLVDVVRAVAIAEGTVASADEPLEGDAYHRAYERARDVYGAPLPRYLTHEDATARYDVLLAAIRECGFFHLDRDALQSTVTAEGDDVGGEAVLALDPAWRESESGESVLVFESGAIWDADTEETLDVVRFVALDSAPEEGDRLLADPTEPLEGEVWREAVRRARTEYGAPLPRWNAGKPDDHVPLLPPSDTLVENPREGDTDELQDARGDVEDLFRDLAEDADTPSVLEVLPSLGKTTSAVKTAADRPTTYLAPRKELQKDAADTAAEYGVDAMHLPVMGGSVRDEVLRDAVAHVREHGKDRLRDRWRVLDEAGGGDVLADESGPEDDDTVDLDRPTCSTAEGDHGEDWALVVHVARELGYTPRDIHTRDHALFGATLPCQDGGECEYTEGWDRVSDPGAAPDLLIGHYVHAHVESARTHYSRRPGGEIMRRPRAVVLDEFPGVDTYAEDYGPEAFDHVTWLAAALRDDVEDLRDVYETDLWADEYVRAWLDGQGDDLEAVGEACGALVARERLLGAREAAADVVERYGESLEDHGLLQFLDPLANGESDGLEKIRDGLAEAVGYLETRPEETLSIPIWAVSNLREEVLEPLEEALAGGLEADPTTLDGLEVGDELRTLLDRAAAAAANREDGARARLRSAADALRGGDAGARELAVWSDDGHAHRDAHHLLRGVVTPTEGVVDATRLETDSLDYGGDEEGTTLDRVRHDRVTTLVDRNGRGATIHAPPRRESGSGNLAPFVGLDATARRELWSLALGEGVTTHDIHDTPRHRRQFLRDVLGLQVLQVGEETRPYEGDPDGKDTDGDVALLRELKERYTGVRAARDRGGDPLEVGRPACITSRVVRDRLEKDDRLDDVVSAWENYGNVTGDNDLGEHTLAGILGSPHYGHNAVEYLAALGGEEVRPSGRGAALDYGSDLGNAYLKHMREDQVMQAILRFSRGETGALVVCRTSAIRPDLPLAGKGEVAETWSPTATALADTWRTVEGETFTAREVAEAAAVDVSSRHVRRLLGELAEAGYLHRIRERDGVATEYAPGRDTPEPAEYDLPTAEAPGREPHRVSYTANVRVRDDDRLLEGVDAGLGSTLPAPAAAAEGDPPD